MEYSYDYSYYATPSPAVIGSSIIVSIFLLICMWKIFTKANVAGWKCLIPFYNAYCLYKITWGNGWFFLLMLIPIANIVIAFITLYKLAKVFGKGVGFFLGLVFLNIIFMAILAFSSATYQGIE